MCWCWCWCWERGYELTVGGGRGGGDYCSTLILIRQGLSCGYLVIVVDVVGETRYGLFLYTCWLWLKYLVFFVPVRTEGPCLRHEKGRSALSLSLISWVFMRVRIAPHTRTRFPRAQMLSISMAVVFPSKATSLIDGFNNHLTVERMYCLPKFGGGWGGRRRGLPCLYTHAEYNVSVDDDSFSPLFYS